MLKLLLFILLVGGLGPFALAGKEVDRFHATLDQYYEEYLALYPVEAAINGDADHRYDAVWPNDISSGHRRKESAMCERYLKLLKGYDRSQLPASDQLSYDALKWNLATARDGLRQIFYLLPVNQFDCPTLTFAQMASGAYVHPFNTAQDFRNFLSRARGFDDWIDTAIANMREGMSRRIVQPRILMERVLGELEPLIIDDPQVNILFAPLKKLPGDLDPAAREKLATGYSKGVRTLMLPAYRKLQEFIRQEYLPHCRTSAGLGELPGGKEAYAWAVRAQTTTDLTPEAIHELGLREVARIGREIDHVQAQVEFKGTRREFLDFAANEPRFKPFKTEEEVLNGYRAIESRVMAGVPKLFGRLPRAKFEIRATEKFRAATASAEYSPGAADGSRPGIFYVPVLHPTGVRQPSMTDLFLHEAIPGHHFQLSLALENTGLPRFRRFDSNNAFVEGWALYCESLGRELGVYQDPYEYLGMLLGDMHRAVRLVVDTGLHAKSWSREQAMDYAAANEGGSTESSRVEIERYMADPAQALGYKIGQLKIRELRSQAEKRLGAKFDPREFHDQILREGSMPLRVLETHMKAWQESAARN